MSVLVTGSAGFIGYHLCSRLLQEGIEVVGIDNLNSYYDKSLKNARLQNLKKLSKRKNVSFKIIEGDISNKDFINEFFKIEKPKRVVNLAAQAGVRYSIENPNEYVQSNLLGFCNIIEGCRHNNVKHLVFASSSSVYGGNTNMPFSEQQGVDHPISLYAATKKSNEVIAHSYSHLYKLPTTGLRFFTVYGPWGRPDMALFLFTKSILEGKPIKIFNNGKMIRDFTYIDDIIEGIYRVLNKPPKINPNFDKNTPNPSKSWAPYHIFNIGNMNPTPLMEFINALEEALNCTAKKEFLPMQPGDVEATSADTQLLENWINYKPDTSVKNGIKKFVDWYKCFYKYS